MERPIDGNELVRSLKNRRLHILMENENDGAAVFDDIVDWIKYTPTITPPNELLTIEPLQLEQLKNMQGKPVWIKVLNPGWSLLSRWTLFSGVSEDINREAVYVFSTASGVTQSHRVNDYGITWVAYRFPSEKKED